MTAENFTLEELARLVPLAHDRGVAVYVALNSLVKPDELEQARSMLAVLAEDVRPDAVIVQDLCFVELVRQTGFTGQIHLSTLAAVTFAGALQTVSGLTGVSRVVLPRELTIDEIKQMAAACPRGMTLEVFVHGALCYGVSGRCYWSSYLGGKSGLRGQCVQPCRRTYAQGEKSGRFFSCLDLSLDVLVKPLLAIPEIATWKIEGRKKGPHYVYYTVTAYKILRDEGLDPAMKKAALQYLEQALGRPTTHYNFLPQRLYPPTCQGEETASGCFAGNVMAGGKNSHVVPRFSLFSGDLLRIGYEDRPGHYIYKVGRSVPRKGRLHLNIPPGKMPAKGTPVFLIDRMEKSLSEKISELESAFRQLPEPRFRPVKKKLVLPARGKIGGAVREMDVYRFLPGSGRPHADMGLWLSGESLRQAAANKVLTTCWLWLPPVIWQTEADEMKGWVDQAIRNRARRFVVNAPWQLSLFDRRQSLEVWAGPFCNLTNAFSLNIVAGLGCSGAIVSPELAGADVGLLAGQSPLPLGIVVAGAWPLCLARTSPGDMEAGRPFLSPKKEAAWVVKNDACFWIYPNWQLDIRDRQSQLEKSGYSLFIRLVEPLPATVSLKKRPGEWNWEAGLA
jgi:putative protease